MGSIPILATRFLQCLRGFQSPLSFFQNLQNGKVPLNVPPKINRIMNILFICTANRDRSRTAEIYFQNKFPLQRFRSAGINKYLSERHGGIHLKKYMLDCADRIICAEQIHADYITSKIDAKYVHKIEVMNLGDTENFMTDSLISLLNEKFSN